MFEKILVVSEISLNTKDIPKYIKGLKKLGAGKCLLLHCINPYEARPEKPSYVTSYGMSVVEENLKKQKEILEQEGYEVETRVIYGFVKNEINKIAQEEGISLVVARAENHSMLGEILFCGVACQVLYNSKKPILLLRVPEKIDDGEAIESDDILNHILFPTDFSENANVAFEYLKKMVSNGMKKVTIVHVQNQFEMDPHILYRLQEFNEIDEEKLQNLKLELLKEGDVEVETKLLFGSPTAEIMSLASEGISLIVMGRQGKGYLEEIFLGSLSNNLSRHVSVSMLLIPSK